MTCAGNAFSGAANDAAGAQAEAGAGAGAGTATAVARFLVFGFGFTVTATVTVFWLCRVLCGAFLAQLHKYLNCVPPRDF